MKWMIGALTLLFVGLKLGRVIDWSWPWVFSPILIAAHVIVLLLALIGLATVAAEKRRAKK